MSCQPFSRQFAHPFVWVIGLGILLGQATLATAASVEFPADAGVINLTNWSSDPLLNAVPNDGIDDTAAIQAALNTFPSQKKIFYLPDGQYDISDTLRFVRANAGSLEARNVFQGQSRDGVVLKLADNLQNPDMTPFDGAMFTMGGGSADHFENVVRNLTFDIGIGNSKATGLEYNASNQGTARDLLIRSGDGSGHIGLDIGYTDNIGPLLVKGVEVEGFDTGIRSQFQVASKVLEDITVRNQNVVGFQNSNTAVVAMRNFRSENHVPAISNSIPIDTGGGNPGNGRLTLLDSQLIGLGGASTSLPAILNANHNSAPTLYARNVEVSGYEEAISNPQQTLRGNWTAVPGDIEEYWYTGPVGGFRNRGGTYQAFSDTPDTGLGLPIRETPVSPNNPLTEWASPLQFGGSPDDLIDDTAAIQAAIDSGAKTVYLPNGEWIIDGTLTVRGEVEQIVGTESKLHRTNNTGKIVIADGTPETVFIERTTGGRLGSRNPVRFEHDSSRELVFKHVANLNYVPVAENPGDLFLEDIVGGKPEPAAEAPGAMIFRNQNVWARQYNNEAPSDTNDPNEPDTRVLVDNANVWILGYKAERTGTLVKVINGGRAEIIGPYYVGPGQSDSDNPAFVVEESSLSVAGFSIRPGNDSWDVFARETRNGVTVDSVNFSGAEVYSAFDDATLWDLRQEIYIDNSDQNAITLTGDWVSDDGFPGGFLGDNFSYSNDPNAVASYRPDLRVAGEYEVLVRHIGEWFNQPSSGRSTQTPIRVLTADGDQMLRIDQGSLNAAGNGFDFDGGVWRSLGTFGFTAGDTLGLDIFADALVDGKIIADGVRFILVEEAMRGDFNFDGSVDAVDYTVWRDGLGSTYTIDDYLVWRENFGAPGNEPISVPEPSLLPLLFAALLVRTRWLR
ncbi:MAG: glycosyl hydrolase family 28-related protein [Planctomycetota bacterium]